MSFSITMTARRLSACYREFLIVTEKKQQDKKEPEMPFKEVKRRVLIHLDRIQLAKDREARHKNKNLH